MDHAKQKIIRLFNKSVRGKTPRVSGANPKHAGKYGHWLEKKMGIKPNASNSPDLFGYEMKNHTTAKTTFGDWSADYYIFRDPKSGIDRNQFLAIFGKPNAKKAGRPSWSGQPTPKINSYNNFGQTLIITPKKDIAAVYNYALDKRTNKNNLIPQNLQKRIVILACWKKKTLKKKVEDKFNQKGWFKCLHDNSNVYNEIVFGEPITFANWLKWVRSGDIFFDSGMYKGNPRNYSQWRASNTFWDSLITSRY